MTRRSYAKVRRAEAEADTRRKIVLAAIDLHQRKGVAATSMRDVGQEAGVATATVYRHFPDPEALLGACSGAFFEANPPPDPQAWLQIADPAQRLICGLTDIYGFYRRTEPMLSRVLPELQGHAVLDPYHAYQDLAARTLLSDLACARLADVSARAAMHLALGFETWALLSREGLSDAEAATLMARLFLGEVQAAANPVPEA